MNYHPVSQMILFDWPLFTAIIIFAVLSYIYGIAAYYVFGKEFRWILCSVVGISFVTMGWFSIVYVGRILHYGDNYTMTGFQVVWDLFWIYSAALPGMLWLEREQKKLE